MTQYELAILICALESAGVAIDAKNRGGDFGARLPHDELPRGFAFFAFSRNHPQASDRGDILGRERRRSEALRLKWIDCFRIAAGAVEVSFNDAVAYVGFQLRCRVIPVER